MNIRCLVIKISVMQLMPPHCCYLLSPFIWHGHSPTDFSVIWHQSCLLVLWELMNGAAKKHGLSYLSHSIEWLERSPDFCEEVCGLGVPGCDDTEWAEAASMRSIWSWLLGSRKEKTLLFFTNGRVVSLIHGCILESPGALIKLSVLPTLTDWIKKSGEGSSHDSNH